ncbi:MAG: hypothetical protein H3C35_03685 [Bacteroidetes bacterium]|nr:hypothetical protein [Bacteroidota bacterium]
MAKQKVTLAKEYRFMNGKEVVVIPANKEVELDDAQLKNIDKKDIVTDEKK